MSPSPSLAVTLDLGPAVHQQAGLSRYAHRLAAALYNDHQDDLLLRGFYNRHSGHTPPPDLGRVPLATLPMSQLPWRLSVLASQLMRLPYAPLLPLTQGSQVYHATEHLLPRLPMPSVLTVHDLIFERYPQHHTATNRLFLRLAMPRFARAAARIIAVSHHTAQDLQELYGISADRIDVIYEGIDPEFSPWDAEDLARVRQRYSPDRPYLLMLGTLEPRKNHALALQSLARLKAAGFPHRLVVAGGKGWLFEPVQALVDKLGLAADVHFAGYVPGDDLPGLYGAADCLLMPSLYEGFGLPMLEAMACGTPVICSLGGSLGELAGDAALITPVDRSDDLAHLIMLLLTQPGLRRELIRRGLEHAGRFTWEKTARQTVETYRAAAAIPAP